MWISRRSGHSDFRWGLPPPFTMRHGIARCGLSLTIGWSNVYHWLRPSLHTVLLHPWLHSSPALILHLPPELRLGIDHRKAAIQRTRLRTDQPHTSDDHSWNRRPGSAALDSQGLYSSQKEPESTVVELPGRDTVDGASRANPLYRGSELRILLPTYSLPR